MIFAERLCVGWRPDCLCISKQASSSCSLCLQFQQHVAFSTGCRFCQASWLSATQVALRLHQSKHTFFLHNHCINMDIGISKSYLGIQAIIYNPQGTPRVYRISNSKCNERYTQLSAAQVTPNPTTLHQIVKSQIQNVKEVQKTIFGPKLNVLLQRI